MCQNDFGIKEWSNMTLDYLCGHTSLNEKVTSL